jgi:peptidoglycan/LPS O-acetylase OafA/YrhL
MQRFPPDLHPHMTYHEVTPDDRPSVVDHRSHSAPPTPQQNLDWLNALKAIALLWVGLNHIVERLFGTPYFANPSADWGTLADRLSQAAPLSGYGWADLPVNLLRYVGWTGDQGVQLFLIASGFGCTWSLCRRGLAPLAVMPFYRRRLGRIYPLWWVAHILFLPLVWGGVSLAQPAFYASFLGARFLPGTLYYFSPPWWFIGLLLQLYLVYPLLWQGLRRLGPTRLLIVSCGLGFLLRGLGLALLPKYADQISRGFLFPMRLPEFVAGMSLAVWLAQNPDRLITWVRSLRVRLLLVVAYGIGFALSFTLPGMTISPFVVGVAAFLLIYGLLLDLPWLQTNSVLAWLGVHSYALFLSHQFFVDRLVPVQQLGWAAWGGAIGAMALSGLAALLLEWVTDRALQGWRWMRQVTSS